jgi:hypothetical protein
MKVRRSTDTSHPGPRIWKCGGQWSSAYMQTLQLVNLATSGMVEAYQQLICSAMVALIQCQSAQLFHYFLRQVTKALMGPIWTYFSAICPKHCVVLPQGSFFFAFSPISTRRRMASAREGLSSCVARHLSTDFRNSSETLIWNCCD